MDLNKPAGAAALDYTPHTYIIEIYIKIEMEGE